MKIEEANKIMVEACEIGEWENYLYTANDLERHYVTYCIINGEEKRHGWDINDPRCREVIRGKFKIATDYKFNLWTSYSRLDRYPLTTGKDIKEAEINCILAICEELKK